jgi:uncharacterized protein YjbI with pentapeptide repeats
MNVNNRQFHADLRETDLRGADLREANLAYADLSNADLSNANFTGANLTGTQLTYNKPDWQTAYFNLIADLRENEPEAYKRSRRRIIEKFEAENQRLFADFNELWQNADWRKTTEPRKIDRKP